MSVITLEGEIDHGQVRLKGNVRLPDRTKVYVIVPNVEVEAAARLYTPHLAQPERIADFKMEIIECL